MPQPPATRHRTVNSGHTYILSDPFSHSWYSHLQRLYIFNLSAEDLVGYCNLQLSWIISLSLSLSSYCRLKASFLRAFFDGQPTI